MEHPLPRDGINEATLAEEGGSENELESIAGDQCGEGDDVEMM